MRAASIEICIACGCLLASGIAVFWAMDSGRDAEAGLAFLALIGSFFLLMHGDSAHQDALDEQLGVEGEG